MCVCVCVLCIATNGMNFACGTMFPSNFMPAIVFRSLFFALKAKSCP